MVEHFVANEDVVGSNPISCSKPLKIFLGGFFYVVKLLAFQANETSSSLVSSTTQHWYIDCAPAFQVGEESLILSCCSISFVPMMLSMAVRTKNFAFGDLFFDTVDMPAGMNHSRHTQLFG